MRGRTITAAIVLWILSTAWLVPAAGAAPLHWSQPIFAGFRALGARSPHLTAIACPGLHQCTAVDDGAAAITFDPTGGRVTGRLTIDPDAAGTGIDAISCPALDECVGFDENGNEATFNPQVPGSLRIRPIDTSGAVSIGYLSCPAVDQCTTVDDSGRAITFDPESSARPTVRRITPVGGDALDAVTCPTTRRCVAGDDQDNVIEFDPGGGGRITRLPQGIKFVVEHIACPRECVAIAADGTLFTFDPAHGPLRDIGAALGSRYIAAVACPSAARCIAVTSENSAIGFDPTAKHPAPRRIKIGDQAADVACPSVDRCTIANGYGGSETTFTPSTPARRSTTVIEQTGQAVFACVSAAQCTVLSGDRVLTLDPLAAAGRAPGESERGAVRKTLAVHAALSSCPAATQCTVLGSSGGIETFDPRHPTRRVIRPARRIAGAEALDCPARTLCAVITGRGLVTFNPMAPRVQGHLIRFTAPYVYGLDCPTASLCVALPGSYGNARFLYTSVATFDLLTGRVTHLARLAGGRRGDDLPAGIACPTADQCTAIDQGGAAWTFSAEHPGRRHRTVIARAAQLTGIACGGPTTCTATDNLGHVITGNPRARSRWSAQAVGGAGPLVGISCPAAGLCVAFDDVENMFLGSIGRSANERSRPMFMRGVGAVSAP